MPIALKIAKVLVTSIEGLMNGDDIITKYYTLCESDKEAINKMIETLYNKKN